jgi:hypothetical protein
MILVLLTFILAIRPPKSVLAARAGGWLAPLGAIVHFDAIPAAIDAYLAALLAEKAGMTVVAVGGDA